MFCLPMLFGITCIATFLNPNPFKMKKTVIYLAIAAVVFTFSSCTKEQTALNQLHGTWKLTSSLDQFGNPPIAVAGISSETLVTFFLCDDKDQEDCEGTIKTTTTNSNVVPADVDINSSRFDYSVFEKKQLIWGGNVYEIEKLTKKDLVFHPVSQPLATKTYEKE